MDDPEGQCVGLAPIELTDKPLFDRAFADLAQPICDYTFANTFIWGSSLRLSWAKVHRHLCVFANGRDDLTMLLPPFAEPGATASDLRDCVRDCFELMDSYNHRRGLRNRSRIEYVSDEMLERLLSLHDLNLATAPFSGDYVYDTRKLIDLDGKKLKSKRHARSRFLRDFPDHRTEPLADTHVPACLHLLHVWQRHGDTAHQGEVTHEHMGSDILRHKDTLACELALRHHRDLNLKGLCLFDGDRLAGFTLGEQLSPSQASIVIEKTLPDFYGAAQFIFSEFCRTTWADSPECNIGDDWGIPSLRLTKNSYRPKRMLNKHTVNLGQRVPVPVNGLNVPLANPVHLTEARTPATYEPAVLRFATDRDTDTITTLEHACFNDPGETFNRRQVRCLLANPRAIVVVAESEDKAVGWAVGLMRQHRHTYSGRLYGLAVSPLAHGRGLGRRLANRLIEEFYQRNIRRLFLEVREDNTPAIRLYRTLGFTDHGFLPNYYGQKRHGIRMKLVAPELAAPRAAPLGHSLDQTWRHPDSGSGGGSESTCPAPSSSPRSSP